MDTEIVKVKLSLSNNGEISTDLYIHDDIEFDEDITILEINIDGKNFKGKADNCFDALKQLRQALEEESIQILCNGAVRNVYPSAMAFSMGSTRKAYKLCLGKQALIKDLVDVFEYEKDLEVVSIKEQVKFFESWVNSF